MPSSIRIDEDFYREQYLWHLFKNGYPPTSTKFRQSVKTFYDNVDLRGEKLLPLTTVVSHFNTKIKQNILPRSMKGKDQMEKMFAAVVADFKKKWKTAVPSLSRETANSPRLSNSAVSSVVMKDVQEADDLLRTEPESVEKQLKEKERQLEELQDAYAKLEAGHLAKINEMEKEITGQKEWNEKLKKRNEEIGKNLTQKEERLQQLEKDAAKHEVDKQALEETVRDKDQMLKTVLRMQETLHSLTNKPK